MRGVLETIWPCWYASVYEGVWWIGEWMLVERGEEKEERRLVKKKRGVNIWVRRVSGCECKRRDSIV